MDKNRIFALEEKTDSDEEFEEFDSIRVKAGKMVEKEKDLLEMVSDEKFEDIINMDDLKLLILKRIVESQNYQITYLELMVAEMKKYKKRLDVWENSFADNDK